MNTQVNWTPEQVAHWNALIASLRADEPALEDEDTQPIDVSGYLADTEYEDRRDERNAS